MNEKATYEIHLKDRFSSPLKGLESKMDHFEGKVGGLKSSFQSLGGSIAGAFAGGLVVGGITTVVNGLKEIAIGAVMVTKEFNNMKSAIEFASGKEAGENIQFLDNEINRLGLDLNAAYKGFKTFQGSIMGTALEGEKGKEVFSAVSEAATVMKLSAEQSEGAFLALGQMVSKGTVSAEELRGQLGERLPGAFQIFARSLGVTTSQLGDMLKHGEVLAEDALPKFAAELRKTFSPGVLRAQNDFNSNWNRFNNFILRSRIALGEKLIPALNEFIKILPSLAENLDFTSVTSVFGDLYKVVNDVFNIFSEMFGFMGANLTLFDTLQFLVKGVALAFRIAITPMLGVLTVYKAIVGVVKDSLKVFSGLGEILKGVFSLDADLISKGIGTMKAGFVDLAKNAANTFLDFGKGTYEGYKKIFQGFGGSMDGKASGSTKGNYSGMGGLSKKGAGNSATAGVEKIQAGTRNVTLNINKLIENITYEKWDATSPQKITEQVRLAVLAAVNDVNIVPQ